MKCESFWKRLFLRKNLKYKLFLVAAIFVIHQLIYFMELNQAVVGKLINGSVRTSNTSPNKIQTKWNEGLQSKFIRDNDGRIISLHGTKDQDISKYLPKKQGKFVCFTSKIEIDFYKINDNYCDCPLDGSDEPGTNACNNGTFYCEKSSSHFPEKIASYKVNDGYCDCCDGSDEWEQILLPSKKNESRNVTYYHKSKCPNKC